MTKIRSDRIPVRNSLMQTSILSSIALGVALSSTSGVTAQRVVGEIDHANPYRTSLNLVPTIRHASTRPVELVDLRFMPHVNLIDLQFEDEIREEQNLPYRFAVPNDVRYTPDGSGTWEQVDPETSMWRLRLIAPDAKSINLGFTKYNMPEGGTLFVYATDLSHTIRGFTEADNEDHGELWTPPIAASDIIIEVTVPTIAKNDLVLELSKVNHGYRGFYAKASQNAQSGSCNVDVACPEGIGWEDQISGVALYAYDGAFQCTGFMVNNTAHNRKPFMMTAFHCGLSSGNVASLLVFWNYENSTCRTPGGGPSGSTGDGPLIDFNSGAIFRASWSVTDFTLVELDDELDPAFGVTLLGWDRSSATPTSAVGIHHPNLDEKRISHENNATMTTSNGGVTSPGDGNFIRVIDWDSGTTEVGSSGSPLFDQNNRVVGQLFGGGAACGNNLSDWYGRFSRSWNGGGVVGVRLSDWLDPFGSGAMFLNTLEALTDCNYNGIHDPDEIFSDPSIDCNSNGVPDDCDLGTFLNEDFVNVGALDARGWAIQNNSNPLGTFDWGQGVTAAAGLWDAQAGPLNSWIGATFNAAADGPGPDTISNWLITPEVDPIDGQTFSFWTRCPTGSIYPDRLEARLSTNGASTNVGATESSVGDFTTLLVSVNPSLLPSTYPEIWTKFSVVLTGIGAPTTGRFAFRYYVTDGGPTGDNSDIIGIDTVEYYSETNDLNGDGIPDECITCEGDTDGNNVVDVEDLLDLLAAWGPCLAPCPPDFDGNGVVDVEDLLDLLAAWGPCP
ncbi:MAG: choice-of-anchor J domain-containing protein [Planctomycetota bacterium]|nr:choice-of-anchor J domain-containing protein [Planctomycetota bacterium]